MKRLLIITIFLGYLTALSAQTTIDWTRLGDVTFTEKRDSTFDITYDEASFGPLIAPYEGQEVRIAGYLIPLDAMGINYALSRNPNASCFFCGGAGPETVIELKIAPRHYQRYETDTWQTFSGTLRMYSNNLDQFTYVLEAAKPE